MNFKKGLFYVFVATGIGFVISLINGFIFPKYLSVETYADIKLYQLFVSYVGILHLGYADGMYLRLGGKDLNNENKKDIVSELNTFKIFQVIINIIAIIISIALKNKVLIMVSLSILPVNIINYLKNLYQATGLYDLYSKYTTTNNIMLFAINIILLFCFKTDNSDYYIIGNLVVYVINWILIELAIKHKFFKKVKGKINIQYLYKDIKDGILLMLGNFCTVIFTSIDRMFSNYLLGTFKFAYYSFATSVESLLNVFITPISVTMYNYLCINKDTDKVNRIKKILLIMTSFLIASAYPVKWIINNYITKYNEASNIIFILFSAQLLSIIVRCIHNNLYKSEKKQKRYFKIILITTLLAAITDYIGYIILPANESLAFATLLINIIWFVIAEIDFKRYRYKLKDYLYIITILITYLITGLVVTNAILGFIIYILINIILCILFMNKEILYIVNEISKILKNILIKIGFKVSK